MYIDRFVKTIKKGEKVVDLGCGHDPYMKADVYVDFYIEDDAQREGVPINREILDTKEFVLWDLNKYPYPFKDSEFDFVIASHIAEHLDNPMSFCQEIQRIGKRGYIEAPAKFYEQLYGWDFHKWYVYAKESALVFEEINERSFLGDFVRDLYHVKKDPEFCKLHDDNISKLITSFYWEGDFPFKIISGVPDK